MTNTYVFTNDYKSDLRRHIDALFADKVSTRQQRVDAVQRLTDAYIEHAGERPDVIQLDRLATLILREELTDSHPDKMSRNEYPLLSSTQQDERHNDEVSPKLSEEVGTDGRDYRPRTRNNNRKMKEMTRRI